MNAAGKSRRTGSRGWHSRVRKGRLPGRRRMPNLRGIQPPPPSPTLSAILLARWNGLPCSGGSSCWAGAVRDRRRDGAARRLSQLLPSLLPGRGSSSSAWWRSRRPRVASTLAARYSSVGRSACALIGLLSLLGALAIAITIVVVHEGLPGSFRPSRIAHRGILRSAGALFLRLLGWSLAYFARAQTAEQAQHRHAAARAGPALRSEPSNCPQLDPHFLFNALNGVARGDPRWPCRLR